MTPFDELLKTHKVYLGNFGVCCRASTQTGRSPLPVVDPTTGVVYIGGAVAMATAIGSRRKGEVFPSIDAFREAYNAQYARAAPAPVPPPKAAATEATFTKVNLPMGMVLLDLTNPKGLVFSSEKDIPESLRAFIQNGTV